MPARHAQLTESAARRHRISPHQRPKPTRNNAVTGFFAMSASLEATGRAATQSDAQITLEPKDSRAPASGDEEEEGVGRVLTHPCRVDAANRDPALRSHGQRGRLRPYGVLRGGRLAGLPGFGAGAPGGPCRMTPPP